MRRPPWGAFLPALAVALFALPGGGRGDTGSEAERTSDAAPVCAADVARLQRMLTQKAAKEMLLAALEKDPTPARARLHATRERFERAHLRLAAGDRGPGGLPRASAPVAIQLDRLWVAWKNGYGHLIDAALAGQVDPAAVRRESGEVLTHAEALIQVCVAVDPDAEPGAAARSAELAGCLGVQSQELAKEFLLVMSKTDLGEARRALRAGRALFARTLQGLLDGDQELGLSPCTDRGARTRLAEEERVWRELDLWLEKADFMTDFAPEDLTVVARLSEELLAAAEAATKALREVRAAAK